ncbi:MAG: DUF3365 domain-containing protein [Luteitalea sp.]|nr:DUF3365 domain-containing protein [Luteitalea sp.]
MKHIAMLPLVVLMVFLLRVSQTTLPEYREVRAVVATIIGDTRALLEKEVAAKGAAGAIPACGTVALGLATRHEAEGWRVRRVSLKVRNPADTPDRYETTVLHRFAVLKAERQLGSGHEHAEVVQEDSRRYLRYMRPIFIGSPVCLQCHGPSEHLSPELRNQLQKLYPDDQATGYELGDLRGAVSVKIQLK